MWRRVVLKLAKTIVVLALIPVIVEVWLVGWTAYFYGGKRRRRR